MLTPPLVSPVRAASCHNGRVLSRAFFPAVRVWRGVRLCARRYLDLILLAGALCRPRPQS